MTAPGHVNRNGISMDDINRMMNLGFSAEIDTDLMGRHRPLLGAGASHTHYMFRSKRGNQVIRLNGNTMLWQVNGYGDFVSLDDAALQALSNINR